MNSLRLLPWWTVFMLSSLKWFWICRSTHTQRVCSWKRMQFALPFCCTNRFWIWLAVTWAVIYTDWTVRAKGLSLYCIALHSLSSEPTMNALQHDNNMQRLAITGISRCETTLLIKTYCNYIFGTICVRRFWVSGCCWYEFIFVAGCFLW